MKKKVLFTIWVVLALIASVLISLAVSGIWLQAQTKERKKRASSEVKNVLSCLRQDISVYENVLNYFEFNIQDYSGNIEHSINDARIFFAEDTAMRNLVFFPKNKDPVYYPYFENDIFDFDATEISVLFEDSRKHGILQMALKNRYGLEKGSEILLIDPVYIAGDKGISEFWGFVCCILQTDRLFSSSYLLDLYASGYEFAIVFSDSINGACKFLSVSPGNNIVAHIEGPEVDKNFDLNDFRLSLTSASISSTLNYGGFSMTLFVTPKGNWTSLADRLTVFFICLVFCILVVFVIDMIYYLAQKESKLIEVSYMDGLTGLFNARKYFEYLKDLQQQKKSFGIFYIDLNDFKPVNDNYGHLIGNEVLSIVGLRLKNCLKQGDIPFRIGGDEFSVIVNPLSEQSDYVFLAARIREVIEKDIILENYRIKVGASIGYAVYTEDCGNYENAVTKAEEMMYADKKKNKRGR